jgi:uncharacterized protein (DUF427 family)
MMNQNRIKPGSGQESAWNYPRPPRVEDFRGHIQIIFNGVTIAETRQAKRVLETSHPPVYYIPPQDIQMSHLAECSGDSFCEWKGRAKYYAVVVNNKKVEKAAWYYPDPTSDFASIKDYVAFYAGQMDACYIDGEKVQPQPGGFYGGWITKNIVGPFKGEPGTRGW